MGVAIEPGDPVEIILDRYAGMESPRTYLIKCPSLREQHKIGVSYEQIFESGKSDDLYPRAHAWIEKVLIGWKNVPTPFSVDAIWEEFNFQKAKEFIAKVLACGRVDDEEKKE